MKFRVNFSKKNYSISLSTNGPLDSDHFSIIFYFIFKMTRQLGMACFYGDWECSGGSFSRLKNITPLFKRLTNRCRSRISTAVRKVTAAVADAVVDFVSAAPHHGDRGEPRHPRAIICISVRIFRPQTPIDLSLFLVTVKLWRAFFLFPSPWSHFSLFWWVVWRVQWLAAGIFVFCFCDTFSLALVFVSDRQSVLKKLIALN